MFSQNKPLVIASLLLTAHITSQAAVRATPAVTEFVKDPVFCLMLAGSPGHEDGVSRDYMQASNKALDSLLKLNPGLTVPIAFSFLNAMCDAKTSGNPGKTKPMPD